MTGSRPVKVFCTLAGESLQEFFHIQTFRAVVVKGQN